MHSLARAVLVLLPLGALAATSTRPTRASLEMTLLVAATTGADYTIDLSRPAGSRITSLTVRGKPVSAADSFTLALNNYRRSGGGGYAMLRDAPEVYNNTAEIRDLLIAEVERRKRIAPADYFQRNWSIVPPAAIPPAYAATHHWTP